MKSSDVGRCGASSGATPFMGSRSRPLRCQPNSSLADGKDEAGSRRSLCLIGRVVKARRSLGSSTRSTRYSSARVLAIRAPRSADRHPGPHPFVCLMPVIRLRIARYSLHLRVVAAIRLCQLVGDWTFERSEDSQAQQLTKGEGPRYARSGTEPSSRAFTSETERIADSLQGALRAPLRLDRKSVV